MVIDINQKKMSVGDKYTIFMNNRPTHYASLELFRFLPVLHLFENHDDRPRMTINQKFFIFNAKYDIIRNNQLYTFRTKSFWKNHFQSTGEGKTYDVYGYRGRLFSVVTGGRQVASWSKKPVSWFSGDNYKINALNDSDYELIICFCLIMDNYISQNSTHQSEPFEELKDTL